MILSDYNQHSLSVQTRVSRIHTCTPSHLNLMIVPVATVLWIHICIMMNGGILWEFPLHDIVPLCSSIRLEATDFYNLYLTFYSGPREILALRPQFSSSSSRLWACPFWDVHTCETARVACKTSIEFWD